MSPPASSPWATWLAAHPPARYDLATKQGWDSFSMPDPANPWSGSPAMR